MISVGNSKEIICSDGTAGLHRDFGHCLAIRNAFASHVAADRFRGSVYANRKLANRELFSGKPVFEQHTKLPLEHHNGAEGGTLSTPFWRVEATHRFGARLTS